ncbi:MAG: CapA family protein [Candidatus Woesebacteria bacterium]|nr:CapA family protein [Candidatus Woesebacteria bacterium]
MNIISVLLVSLATFVNFGLFNVVKQTSLIFTGDVMLGRSVMTKSLKINNLNYPFMNVANILRSADIVFSNLENPIIDNCPYGDSGFKFCADPKMIEGLKYAGVDIVNLANNHILNYGKEGLIQTKKYLDLNGIKWVGDGNLVIIEKNKTKFGFLGFNFVTVRPQDKDLDLIRNSKTKVDILIVSVHWGEEYKSKANSNQKLIARQLSEAGADYLIGHHPHWIQDMEMVGSTKVYYSLGNFVFDQMWSEETKKGLSVNLIFKGKKLEKENLLKLYMGNFAQPKWVN